jgi:hypothetical protein
MIGIPAFAADTPADRVLERLRGLAGTWEGTFEWTGARTGSGTARAVYSTAGARSTVVENLFMNGQAEPSMTTAYHLDGADLRMTHYCAAQNQPRLKATELDEKGGVVHFSFIDATNLQDHPAHVVGFEIRFVSENELVLRFTFDSKGAKSVEHIALKRAKKT